MAVKLDVSLDELISRKKFIGQKRSFVGGAASKFNKPMPPGKPDDLRSVLAKKHSANITDLRTKLKPKALYTSKLPSKSSPAIPTGNGGRSGNGKTNDVSRSERKKLKLTASFKNSISSAVSPLNAYEGHKSSSRSRSRKSDPGLASHRSSSSRLPSYEEAKKISVTVPGLSRPVSEYPSNHRSEERLAAHVARSREMRQDGFMRGREEFLASAITSAVGGGAGGGAGGFADVDGGGGGGGGGGGMLRDRGTAGSVSRVQRGRSPSPAVDYTYNPIYPAGNLHSKVLPSAAAPPPSASHPSYSTRRGLTTATSMIISNLSDTVSKNDVAELCSVVGTLDGVYMHAPGIAEVVFKYKDDALEAFKKYNQRNLDGQPMHCKMQPASRSRMSTGVSYGHSYAADDYFPHSGSGYF